ncbi:hypothetical protein COUCH_19475 [Couchioplanes caeruleus]|uniref:hypothetical protein n=1 Tax=Couchioplanes caeruleus TaxID=56438 RepID=UPI0020BF9BAA|nr:hypothetical protein [Couchioplanes caeruleus]UQU61251.1 hypothetical protein COUCH_19475 [Couchioplanes caeruleus]
MSLTRLLVRRIRWTLGAWLLLLVGICFATVPAYQNTYATDQQRRAAVELARADRASTVLYGQLPGPGTPAQMYAWEAGAIVTILVAVMAVLVTVSLTRAPEDDGTLELLRGSGVPQRRPLHSAMVVLAGTAVLLGLGCGVAAGLHTGGVEGVTWSGAAAFGTTIALTFLVLGAGTAVLAQVAATAGHARMLGLAAVGAAFAVRAAADVSGTAALNRLSPLGLRATIGPFTAGHWDATVPPALAVILLAALAEVLSRRREFGAGFLRRRATADSRLRTRTPVGLSARLGRSSLLAWTVAVAAVGTLFASMGSGTVEQSRGGDLGGFLGSQLGTGDPVAAYLAYSDTVVGIVVCAYAVLSVLAARRWEAAGLTDLVLTTGVRRWAPLAAQAAVTAGGCAVILVATGVLGALVTPAVIDGQDVGTRAFAYAIGQWPAAVATTGFVALLIGLSPRLSALAWLPLTGSALLALFGPLLEVPERIQDLGFFRHVPDVAGPGPAAGALAVMVGLGVALSLLGAAATTRRDVRLS